MHRGNEKVARGTRGRDPRDPPRAQLDRPTGKAKPAALALVDRPWAGRYVPIFLGVTEGSARLNLRGLRRGSVLTNVVFSREAPFNVANDASALERDLRAYVNDLVHQPLKRAGYRRSGRVWRAEGDGVVRVVDLQRERQSSRIDFTLNVGIAVPGYHWYLYGFDDGQPDASLGVVSGRIGFAFDPPRDVWFVVAGSNGLSRTDWVEPESPSDGSELVRALDERVVPTLALFSTPGDVLTYLAEPQHQLPFLSPLLARNPDEPLRAVVAWREAGSPVPSVAVSPSGDSGVLIQVPPELVEERPDLVETMVDAATPVDDAIHIRNVVPLRPGVVEVYGGRLRADRMQAAYERFLAVRRFGAAPQRRSTQRWPSPDEDDLDLEEVSVEWDEDGNDVLVSFSDEVAHEHVDLVEACVERCRAFPGVQFAHWQDRELIVVRGADVNQRRLQEELMGFIREALASRSAEDHADDE